MMQWLANLEQKMQTNFAVTPSSGVVFPFLDGLRGYTAITAVVIHCWVYSGSPPIFIGSFDLRPYLATTYIMIDMYFLLSSILLSLAWHKARLQGRPAPKLWSYYKQRFSRITPAYYCALFVMLLLMTPQYIPPQTVFSGEGALRIGIHMVYMQFAFPVSAGTWLVNGTVWSLTIEVTFYLILPWLILLFLNRRWWFWLPVSLVITVAWEYLSYYSLDFMVDFWRRPGAAEENLHSTVSYQFPAYLFCLCLGMSFSSILARYVLKSSNGRLFTLFTGRGAGRIYFVAGWILLLYNTDKLYKEPIALDTRIFCQIVLPVACILIVAGLLFGGPHVRWFFNLLPLRFLGLISYSFVLWHMPLIFIILKYPAIQALDPVYRFWVVLALDMVLTTIISIGSFLALEKPFMKIKKNRPSRSIAEVPGGAAALVAASPDAD